MKIGSVVMFTDGIANVVSKRRRNRMLSEAYPDFYPPVKTIGTVIDIDRSINSDGSPLYIQWPVGSTSGNDRWWCGAGNVLEL